MEKKEYLQLRTVLYKKTNRFQIAKHVLTDVLILGSLGALWSVGDHSWWMVLGSVGVCALMFRSFAMMHEAVHGYAVDSRLNDYAGIFYGGLAFLAFEPWKKAHLEHHYWSGNADKDPVMAVIIAFPKFSPRLQNFLTRCWMAWFPILGILQNMVFWMLSIKNGLKRPFTLKSILSLAWPLVLWTSLFQLFPSSAISFMLLPGVFMYLVLTEFVNLPHHLRLPQRTGEERLQIWNQHESARSCVYPAWMERFITLNFNYHTEHHMFPDLPWYQLAEAHAILKEKLGDALNVDAQFSWTKEHRKEDLRFVLAKDLVSKDEAFFAPTGTQSAQVPRSSAK